MFGARIFSLVLSDCDDSLVLSDNESCSLVLWDDSGFVALSVDDGDSIVGMELFLSSGDITKGKAVGQICKLLLSLFDLGEENNDKYSLDLSTGLQ